MTMKQLIEKYIPGEYRSIVWRIYELDDGLKITITSPYYFYLSDLKTSTVIVKNKDELINALESAKPYKLKPSKRTLVRANQKFVVYMITNLDNDKKYVGITNNFKRRKEEHARSFKNGGANKKFLNDINKGLKNLVIEIVSEANGLVEAYKKERELINKYNTIEDGYNCIYQYRNGILDM